MAQKTKPWVFIIESNDEEDEKRGISEGRILRGVLRMMGKPVEYRYIRTKEELVKMRHKFQASRFRYLHIACHGWDGGLSLTSDSLPYQRFAKLIGPALNNRRLFVSACNVGSGLAKAIYHGSSPYSVTAPFSDINFADSAVVWASFYCRVFKSNRKKMKESTIRHYLRRLCRLHRVEISHFSRNGRPNDFDTWKFSYLKARCRSPQRKGKRSRST